MDTRDVRFKEVFTCDFLANPRSEYAKKLHDSMDVEEVNHPNWDLLVHYHSVEDLKHKPTLSEFLGFADNAFEVVVHETRLLRYARPTIEIFLLIATSIVVKDKQTGRFSAARPFAKEINHMIPVDELGIFLMENGNVVFSLH